MCITWTYICRASSALLVEHERFDKQRSRSLLEPDNYVGDERKKKAQLLEATTMKVRFHSSARYLLRNDIDSNGRDETLCNCLLYTRGYIGYIFLPFILFLFFFCFLLLLSNWNSSIFVCIQFFRLFVRQLKDFLISIFYLDTFI